MTLQADAEKVQELIDSGMTRWAAMERVLESYRAKGLD